MSKKLKQILSVAMVAVMILSAAPLAGFVGLELPSIFSLEADAAEANLAYNYKVVDNEVYITGVKSKDIGIDTNGVANIPEFIDGFPVVKIDDRAFEECYEITKLGIPGTVTSIGNSAFKKCTGLETVKNYAEESGRPIEYYDLYSVVEIGINAFENCVSLKEIALPDGLELISKYAFSGCSSLGLDLDEKEIPVIIPDSVKTIGEYAFAGCSSISDLKIGLGVNGILTGAFNGCDGVRKLEIGKAISSHTLALVFSDGNADNYYDSIEEIIISEDSGVTKIDNEEFRGFTSLAKIEIPDTVTEIGDRAFEACENLAEIGSFKVNNDDATYYALSTLVNLNTIGKYAFAGTAVEKVDIPDGVTVIPEGAFALCADLNEVDLPPYTTRIDDYAFNGCGEITVMNLPSTVIYIGKQAFADCSKLHTTNIPVAVVEIGDNAYSGCEALDDAYYGDDKNTGYLDSSRWTSYTKRGVGNELLLDALNAHEWQRPGSDTIWDVKYDGKDCWSFDRVNDIAVATIKCEKEGHVHYATDNAVQHEKDIPATCTVDGKKNRHKATVEFRSRIYTGLDYDVVPHFGHDMEAKFTWNEDHTAATVDVICKRCAPNYTKPLIDDATATVVIGDADPTCTADGKVERTATYVVPAAIGYTAEDTPFKNIYTVVKTKLGHDEEIKWTWNGLTSAKADFICKTNDKHNKTGVVADITSKVTKAPTCTAVGERTYTATIVVDEQVFTSTKVVDEPATGHNWSGAAWTWTGYSKATATFTCGNCTLSKEVTDDTISSVTTNATCTAEGKTVYTAEVSYLGKTYKDEKTQTLDDLGHYWSDWTVVKYPGIDKEGLNKRTCYRCNEVEEKKTPATGKAYVEPTTGIIVEVPTNALPAGFVLEITRVTSGVAYNKIMDLDGLVNGVVYKVTAKVGGAVVLPTAPLTIRIPNSYTVENTSVKHYVSATGGIVDVASSYSNGYYVFKSADLGIYGIVEIDNPSFFERIFKAIGDFFKQVIAFITGLFA